MKTHTVESAAELLATDATTVRALIDEGRIPAAKIGRAWVMMEDDLQDYLTARIREQTAERLERAANGQRIRAQSEVSSTRRYRGRKLPVLPELVGEARAA